VSASAASGHTRGSERTNRQTRSAASHEPARRSRKLARKAGTSQAVNAVTVDELESLLSGNGGLTTTALAERAKTKRDQVLVLLRELEAASRIRRTGQRRATRWHAITDEDRIRERAAELEATRKRTT
jgi:shikimate 5-dehydrogenase